MTAAEIIAVRRTMLASCERAIRDLVILTKPEEQGALFAELVAIIDEIRATAEATGGRHE